MSGKGLDAVLWDAVGDGEVTEVHHLLREGANLRHRDKDGWTLLCWGAYRGRAEVCKLLLHLDSSAINVATYNGRTPLRIAASSGRAEVMEVLLASGADADRPCNQGKSPLFCAALKGHLRASQLLVSHGAAITPNHGPEHEAVQAFLDSISQGLAETMPWSEDGTTPTADLAEQQPNSPAPIPAASSNYVLAITRSGHAPIRGSVAHRWAVLWQDGIEESSQMDRLRRMLKKGESAKWTDKEGWSPLAWAALGGRARVLSLLLSHGADVDGRTNDGRTPLRIAAYNGKTQAIKVLLANGAKVNACCNEGKTPLFAAASEGHVEAARLLWLRGGELRKPTVPAPDEYARALVLVRGFGDLPAPAAAAAASPGLLAAPAASPAPAAGRSSVSTPTRGSSSSLASSLRRGSSGSSPAAAEAALGLDRSGSGLSGTVTPTSVLPAARSPAAKAPVAGKQVPLTLEALKTHELSCKV